MRLFTTSKPAPGSSDNEPSFTGLGCSRESGVALTFDESEIITVVEERFSPSLLTSINSGPPKYTIVGLADFDANISGSDRFATAWHSRLPGISAFLQVLRQYLHIWDQKWIEVLDHINNTVKIQVRNSPGLWISNTDASSLLQLEDILNPPMKSRLMFDRDFKLFDCEDGDLKDLEVFGSMIDLEWEAVLSFRKEVAIRQVERILGNTAGIKSLRDGMSLRKMIYSYIYIAD